MFRYSRRVVYGAFAGLQFLVSSLAFIIFCFSIHVVRAINAEYKRPRCKLYEKGGKEKNRPNKESALERKEAFGWEAKKNRN